MKMEEENINDTINIATGLAVSSPIYQDLLQPATIEVGKSLEIVAKTIRVALAPISVLIWGYEKIGVFLENKISEKLKNTPEENIITPDPVVVGPSIEALRYSANNEIIRELYANLIANAMDKETVKKAHPCFVEIIKNMTSDEGLILKIFETVENMPLIDIIRKKNTTREHFVIAYNCSLIGIKADCKYIDLSQKYIDNLCRLGILQIPVGKYITNKNHYDELINTNTYKNIKEEYENKEWKIVPVKKYIELTELGVMFLNACVIDKSK